MVFKDICVFEVWMKVASALEGLRICDMVNSCPPSFCHSPNPNKVMHEVLMNVRYGKSMAYVCQ